MFLEISVCLTVDIGTNPNFAPGRVALLAELQKPALKV
jgi:hypothetical protein